jgi:type I restriction enzyme S subunit
MNDFFLEGVASDLGYVNIRDIPHHENVREFVAQLWRIYKPYSDPHFREDAKNHFLQRFWEMYLAVTLINKGFNIERAGNEGPEFYFVKNDKRIWVEAIAPGPGEGADRVPEPEPGVATEVPTEKILLRYTHALVEKTNRYKDALEKEIIKPEDGYILAVNCRAIPHAPYGNTMPYYIQAYLPFGPYAVSIDKNTGDIIESFYQSREAVSIIKGVRPL